MNSPPRFDPIYPAHAIERCATTIVFDQALPPKIWSSLRTMHRDKLLAAGMKAGPPTVGMQIDVTTGSVVPVEGGGPSAYLSENGAETITLASNQINVTTTLYTRWANFEATLAKLLVPLAADYSRSVSIAAIQLEYVDRFIWSGTWDNFSSASLLIMEGELFAARPARARQWHSHSGWFETGESGKRRLININIDTVPVVAPNSAIHRPSIGIRTVIQDVAAVIPPRLTANWFAEGDVLPILLQEHSDLKELLGRIISPEMATRIGLQE